MWLYFQPNSGSRIRLPESIDGDQLREFVDTMCHLEQASNDDDRRRLNTQIADTLKRLLGVVDKSSIEKALHSFARVIRKKRLLFSRVWEIEIKRVEESGNVFIVARFWKTAGKWEKFLKFYGAWKDEAVVYSLVATDSETVPREDIF